MVLALPLPPPAIDKFLKSSKKIENVSDMINRLKFYREATELFQVPPDKIKEDKVKVKWDWDGFSMETEFNKKSQLLKATYKDKDIVIDEIYNPENIIIVNGNVIWRGLSRIEIRRLRQ